MTCCNLNCEETRVTLPFTRHRRVIAVLRSHRRFHSPTFRRKHRNRKHNAPLLTPNHPSTESFHRPIEISSGKHHHTHHAFAYISPFIGDQPGGSTNRRKASTVYNRSYNSEYHA
ncbi:hypothetical protein F2Q69_00032287 [Brassica cretica]|uniref:Uncharacterized protein n=1 Tax=Brassica cretica TaxID=69181 RepID=A0A8S9RZ75_BRACR|nr:hypothetical protein F2Q69_00032287 [Brassica cretica]